MFALASTIGTKDKWRLHSKRAEQGDTVAEWRMENAEKQILLIAFS